MKLSLLILTTSERKHFLNRILKELYEQINSCDVIEDIEILINDCDKTIGGKRNELVGEAKGKYLAFLDDDDMPGNYYIYTLLKGIDLGYDSILMRGHYYIDGKLDGVFAHSIKYKEWKTNDSGPIKYERQPNHLNCIKSSIAKQIHFPLKNFAEDHEWSKLLLESGLIKTEYEHQEILYHYYYRTNK